MTTDTNFTRLQLPASLRECRFGIRQVRVRDGREQGLELGPRLLAFRPSLIARLRLNRKSQIPQERQLRLAVLEGSILKVRLGVTCPRIVRKGGTIPPSSDGIGNNAINLPWHPNIRHGKRLEKPGRAEPRHKQGAGGGRHRPPPVPVLACFTPPTDSTPRQPLPEDPEPGPRSRRRLPPCRRDRKCAGSRRGRQC
jgi:hypothetical protein